jgi:hypothetical protein
MRRLGPELNQAAHSLDIGRLEQYQQYQQYLHCRAQTNTEKSKEEGDNMSC